MGHKGFEKNLKFHGFALDYTMRGKQRKIERIQFPRPFYNYHRGAPF